jgi:hypothetical protein
MNRWTARILGLLLLIVFLMLMLNLEKQLQMMQQTRGESGATPAQTTSP